jgi:hypothetical protein
VLSHHLEFVPARDAEIFADVSAAPAVFLLRGDDPQSEPYLSKTANLRRRLQRLLGPPTEHSKKLNLRDRVRWIEFTPTGSDFESGFLLYRLLRSIFRKSYSDRLRLRFAPDYALTSCGSAPNMAAQRKVRSHDRPNYLSLPHHPEVGRRRHGRGV